MLQGTLLITQSREAEVLFPCGSAILYPQGAMKVPSHLAGRANPGKHTIMPCCPVSSQAGAPGAHPSQGQRFCAVHMNQLKKMRPGKGTHGDAGMPTQEHTGNICSRAEKYFFCRNFVLLALQRSPD